MRNFHIYIPARLESTRLPRKLLLPKDGKPIILHTIDAAQRLMSSSAVSPYLMGITVLTDSEEIRHLVNSYCRAMYYPVRCFCRMEHLLPVRNGCERIGRHLSYEATRHGHIAVNWQADEPMLVAKHFRAVLKEYDYVPSCDMQTIAVNLAEERETVIPIPVGQPVEFFTGYDKLKRERFQAKGFVRGRGKVRHLGLYAGSENFFIWYSQLDQSKLEKERKLEQMRVIERGGRVNVAIIDDHDRISIDTREDYERFCEIKGVVTYGEGKGDFSFIR